MKKCINCSKKKVIGRSDKLFCTISCKNKYHRRLRSKTDLITPTIDTVLHRNRSILLEVLGEINGKIKVARILLEKKKFRFKYHTHFHINSGGKMYHHVYDLAWMSFSDDEILIVRRKKTESKDLLAHLK